MNLKCNVFYVQASVFVQFFLLIRYFLEVCNFSNFADVDIVISCETILIYRSGIWSKNHVDFPEISFSGPEKLIIVRLVQGLEGIGIRINHVANE